MTTTAESPTRALRSDAARNRRLLLDAGREVFAARGLEVSLDDIAHHAGVGVGTAYRHFANKQELAEAIFSDDLDQLVESAREALRRDDPWDGLVYFVETTVTKHARDRGLYELMADPARAESVAMPLSEKAARLRESLVQPLTELLENAKAAGCVREDASPTDVGAIFCIMGGSYLMSDAVQRPIWRRHLWLLLDGLRATGRPALPCAALDFEEMETVLIASKKH